MAHNQLANRFMDDIVIMVSSKQANNIHILHLHFAQYSAPSYLALNFVFVQYTLTIYPLNSVCGHRNELAYGMLTCYFLPKFVCSNYYDLRGPLRLCFRMMCKRVQRSNFNNCNGQQQQKQTNCRILKLGFPLFSVDINLFDFSNIVHIH